MLKDKYANYVISLIKGRFMGIHFPLEATISVTNRCNLKCIYCFGDFPLRQKDDFTTEEIKNLIDEMYSMGLRFVHISGGEPLMRKDIDQILWHVRSKNIILDLCTNGTLVERNIELLKKTVDFVAISIDGNKDITDRYRGEGVYDMAIKAVRVCRTVGIQPRVNAVLCNETVDSIEHLIYLSKAEKFYLSFNLPYGSQNKERDKYLTLDDEKIRQALNLILSYKKKGYPITFSLASYQYVINWPFSLKKVYLTEEDLNGINFKHNPCFYGRYICVIDGNGDVYPCTHYWGKESFIPMNMKKVGFKKAWEHLVSYRYPCKTCTDISFSEHNLFFKPSLSVWVNQVFNILRRNKGD